MPLHVDIHADVECTDDQCGECTDVIINPTDRKVTHFVVEDMELPDSRNRLVPVDRVEETTHNLIRLNCTKDELAGMDPFRETRYTQKEMPHYPTSFCGGEPHAYVEAHVTPAELIPVEIERVAPGELAVHRGTGVEATDGWVGRVDKLLVDPVSGDITHLVLRQGHLWGKKDLTLPISAIDRVSDDTLYLKLDKRSI
jgi:sporulation protein YlmC with PRC-barrel domain